MGGVAMDSASAWRDKSQIYVTFFDNTVGFADNDDFCRFPQNILFIHNDSCKFSLQFEV